MQEEKAWVTKVWHVYGSNSAYSLFPWNQLATQNASLTPGLATQDLHSHNLLGDPCAH